MFSGPSAPACVADLSPIFDFDDYRGPWPKDNLDSPAMSLLQRGHFGSSVCMRASHHTHAIHGERLIVSRCFLALSFSVCLTFTLLFSSHFYLYSDLNSFHHVDKAEANNSCASANRGVLHLVSPTSLTTSTTRRLLR